MAGVERGPGSENYEIDIKQTLLAPIWTRIGVSYNVCSGESDYDTPRAQFLTQVMRKRRNAQTLAQKMRSLPPRSKVHMHRLGRFVARGPMHGGSKFEMFVKRAFLTPIGRKLVYPTFFICEESDYNTPRAQFRLTTT